MFAIVHYNHTCRLDIIIDLKMGYMGSLKNTMF